MSARVRLTELPGMPHLVGDGVRSLGRVQSRADPHLMVAVAYVAEQGLSLSVQPPLLGGVERAVPAQLERWVAPVQPKRADAGPWNQSRNPTCSWAYGAIQPAHGPKFMHTPARLLLRSGSCYAIWAGIASAGVELGTTRRGDGWAGIIAVYLYCQCGYPFLVSAVWTGTEYYLVLRDGLRGGASLPIIHCPHCGRGLVLEEMGEQPSSIVPFRPRPEPDSEIEDVG